jgi:hypothetical protein
LISGILNIGKARHWTVTPKFARKTMQATTAAVSTDRAKQSTTAENLLSFSMKPMDNLSTDFLVNDTPSASPIPSNNSSSLTLPELIPTEGDGADEQVELLVVPSSTSINSNNNIDNKSRLIPIASAYFNNRSRLLSRIKFHPPELLMSMFLSVCAYYGFLMNQTGIATFSLLNALAYVILGFGLMGKIL